MTKVGDKIKLASQEVEVVNCDNCEDLMVNVDADQLRRGDLTILKKAGVKISNPETEDPICLNCEVQTWGHRLSKWFEDDSSDDDDDDSSFFGGTGVSIGSGSLFGGSSSGGFSGFGGGSFGGGGASRSF